MNPLQTLGRAFASNVRTIKLSDAEQQQFAAQGIADPNVQRYFAWRKASIIMVIVGTVLSAAVSTYETATEDDDAPDVVEVATQKAIKKVQDSLKAAGVAVPGEAAAVLKEKAAVLKIKAEALKEKAEDEKPEAADDADAKAKDADDDEEDDDSEKQPAFERFEDAVMLGSIYIMPIAALIVLLLGNRFRLGYRVLVAAFLISFLLPIAFGLCPWSWYGYVEEKTSFNEEPVKYLKDQAEGVQEALEYLLMLLPAVLSLIPGAQKACLRVKTLLPEALLPGWIVIVASPLYSLFILMIFVAIYQAVSAPMVLIGFLLVAIAPMIFAFRGGAIVRPLITEADYRRMLGVARMVGLVTAAGGILLLVFLCSQEFMGIHLVGTDPKTAAMRPITIVEFLLQTIARGMFVSVVGAELFMRFNLKAWQDTRTLAASGADQNYDDAMQAFDSTVNTPANS